MSKENAAKNGLTVAVTGSSGFVGSAVIESLQGMGVKALRLVREKCQVADGTVFWNPADANCDLCELNGISAVVHLAGESIVGLWTQAKRRRIVESRVLATKNLVSGLCSLETPPKTMICASAVGFYGNCGAEILTEESAGGEGFLATTCREWEAATIPAQEAGVRVVNLRIGVALDPSGGALQKAVAAFRLGLGGRFGSGKQYLSWITREDLVRIILFCISEENISGAINAVAPNPITNAEYTKQLSGVLKRPSFMTAPEFLLRLAPGGIAEEMFLSSARAVPARLLSAGFSFMHPDIEQALDELLSKH